jgi:hypothetical protein
MFEVADAEAGALRVAVEAEGADGVADFMAVTG